MFDVWQINCQEHPSPGHADIYSVYIFNTFHAAVARISGYLFSALSSLRLVDNVFCELHWVLVDCCTFKTCWLLSAGRNLTPKRVCSPIGDSPRDQDLLATQSPA